MKRIFLYVGMVLASAAIGGATAYVVADKAGHDSTEYNQRAENVSFGSGMTHFASYQKESFPDLTYAAENAVHAVVNIEVTQLVKGSNRYGGSMDPFFEFFGIPQGYSQQNAPREVKAGGSGVIISPDGYIVTNNHVVEGASKLKVKLYDQRTFDATLVGTDPTSDVALIKIDAENLPILKFGSSDDLRLGEWVLAIGSPFDLQSTITAGIVSAKARNLGAINSQYRIESFIQTDAAVNPGNSGGALVNTAGELIGINTLIESQTGSYIGYSFAVPSSIVQKVVTDLKEYGVVQRAMLGVSYQEINDAFIEQFGEEYGISEIGGAYIASVDPAGAAAAAGIKEGDVLLEIDGNKVNNSADMSEIISRYRPNDKVSVKVKRNGNVKQFDVVLRNKAGKAELVQRDMVDAVAALGGQFAEINDRTKKELGIKYGIQVVSIDSDEGILARARIRRGYVITHINGMEIRSVNDLNRITDKITDIEGVYPDGRSVNYSLVQ
ncbi:MAG: Do family serine endopeptidase [Tidjanibacter sp.]|nr:Do family serine endopeptidase [Tidjanibacter sp.]